MKRSMAAICLVLAAAVPAVAKPKGEYRDATFLKWARVQQGSTCSSNSTTRENTATGNLDTQTSGGCAPDYIYRYWISADGFVYVLERVSNHPIASAFTLGYSDLGAIHSALYGVPEGAPILLRFEKNLEIVHIRAGKKESRFRIIARDKQ